MRSAALCILAVVPLAPVAQAQTLAQAPVARFEHVRYQGDDGQSLPTPDRASFANPVLPGFQPDPSIVRVGDDYYLVNSTFAWFPGLPIYHSRDLVNWRQIGNAIDRPAQMDFGRLGVTRALFAPTIDYHDGVFTILNTCVDCGGNFMLTARNPAGPWSDPIWLKFDGIDPSLFIDDDGRAWIVWNDAPPGKPEYEGHRALWVQEFDRNARVMKGERILLIDKGVNPADKPIWAEGPHIYKKDGWYYLLAAEGGTADQHSQTIYRARSVTGPYVPGPRNPILTQRDLPEGRPNPVQATGHADMVALPDGSWWAVFLATRPYRGQATNLGRETFLLPVTWRDGWPEILPPKVPVPATLTRPALPRQPLVDHRSWRDSFASPRLAPDWLMLRTPKGTPWWRTGRGGLALEARPVAAGALDQPAFIGKRLRHHAATIETRVAFTPRRDGDRAGLLALTDENHFLFAGIERRDGQPAMVVRVRAAASDPEEGRILATSDAAASVGSAIDLKLSFAADRATVAWRPSPRTAWRPVGGTFDASVLATINAGLFTGVVVGPHAASAKP